MFINKRILIAVAVLGILIVGGLGVTVLLLVSHSNASASNLAVTPTTPALTATPRLNANRVCATGVISSVDTQGQSFVVTEKGAKTVTVTIDPQTTFHKRGVTGATFSVVSVGQHVRVTAQGACDPTATTFAAKTITIVVSNVTPSASPTATP